MVDDQVPAQAPIGELFEREYARLVRAALLLVGDLATAEDVVQDAFVAVHRRWGQLEDLDRVGGYLQRAVINNSRSVLRHRGVVRRHEQSSPEPRVVEDISTVVLERADRDAVLAALGRLPRRQREVLVLRYYLDLGEAEIASTLRISKGSVKTHASRGASALRTNLRHHVESGDPHE